MLGRPLSRYLHLNPLRAKVVTGLRALDRYPWSGHSALLEIVPRPWQDTRTILGQFWADPAPSLDRLPGLRRGRDPSGPPARSPRGRATPEPGRLGAGPRGAAPGAHDGLESADPREREVTEHLLAEAARHEKETLRLSRTVADLATVARTLSTGVGIPERELRSGSRRPGVVRARRLFCQAAVKGLGYSGAGVARFLGVTTSSVNRLAVSAELPEVKRYLKARENLRPHYCGVIPVTLYPKGRRERS
jgi:hypothetical protein